jgi:hypothetical protein
MPSKIFLQLKKKQVKHFPAHEKQVQDKKNIIELENKMSNISIEEDKPKTKTPIKPLKYKL